MLLVLDVSGQSQTAAAVAKGFAAYDPAVTIGGVVLNRVASERHRRLAAEAIEAIGIPVVGAIMRDPTLSLPERHLGLVQASEHAALEEFIERLADVMEKSLDLDAVLALAAPFDAAGGNFDHALRPPGQRIALADDAAFTFLYPHVAAEWRRQGAELVPFSPLADQPPPDNCDVCWLPGGYPELHAGDHRGGIAISVPACSVSRRRGRSMASAAASWFSAGHWKMPMERLMKCSACSAMRRASPDAA